MDREQTTALLKAARSGSRDALDALYARVGPRLLALIRQRLGPSLRRQLESRDILQAALLKSFARIDQFERDNGPSLMAWLARIAEHEIRDQVDFHHRERRDAARVVPLESGTVPLAAPDRTPVSQVALSEDLRRLEEALDSLSEAHREIIVLRKLEELSFGEIAPRLGKSEDACRMLLARAMTALTMRLGPRR
jgi:RNA polymerase sigma-70 factor (ECF subfamily)